MPHFHRSLLHDCRHLPLPREGAQLLDLGCGSGRFLDTATGLGWDATGLDPDPLAVAAGRKRGRKIEQGGLPATGLNSDRFDAVTMNHVVEHLHDPVAALRDVHRILKPGGNVWAATPNADSTSHRTFGPYWRGLEAPRHLAIFCSRALRLAFQDAGFVNLRLHKPKLTAAWYFESSLRLASKQEDRAPRAMKTRVLVANWKARLWRAAGEELCITARKPIRVSAGAPKAEDREPAPTD